MNIITALAVVYFTPSSLTAALSSHSCCAKKTFSASMHELLLVCFVRTELETNSWVMAWVKTAFGI